MNNSVKNNVIKRRTREEILQDDVRIRNRIENISTVEDMFWWKNLKDEKFSVENINIDLIQKLGWDKSDVLYSFLGIYLIGVLAYYPDKYIRTEYEIHNDKNEDMYSLKKLRKIYKECNELNKNVLLQKFIRNYFCIGNVMPTWPGANTDRGKSYVFDIPDIYYSKNELWTKILMEIYKNAYLDDVMNENVMFDGDNRYINNPPVFKFTTTPDFLNAIVNDKYPKDCRIWLYSKWLERIVGIIGDRERTINEWIKKNEVNRHK